jgi:hypothetical protein
MRTVNLLSEVTFTDRNFSVMKRSTMIDTVYVTTVPKRVSVRFNFLLKWLCFVAPIFFFFEIPVTIINGVNSGTDFVYDIFDGIIRADAIIQE